MRQLLEAIPGMEVVVCPPHVFAPDYPVQTAVVAEEVIRRKITQIVQGVASKPPFRAMLACGHQRVIRKAMEVGDVAKCRACSPG
jgi:hypothetical protein